MKSPLAVASGRALQDAGGEAATAPAARGAGLTERGITLAEFEEYLRTVNNRDGRPYQEKTINAYVAPARVFSLRAHAYRSAGIQVVAYGLDIMNIALRR